MTFNEAERTVEAYALDRDDLDLYGAHVAIDFSARLRGTVRFDSVDDLVDPNAPRRRRGPHPPHREQSPLANSYYRVA